MPTPLEVLRSVFGYDTFLGPQEAIIDTLLGGRDAVVLMPTGAGKSLCYQIPALIRPGTAVVVSPAHRPHARPGPGVDPERSARGVSQFLPLGCRGQGSGGGPAGREADLLYVAPERLFMPGFLEQLALSRWRFSPSTRRTAFSMGARLQARVHPPGHALRTLRRAAPGP